MRPFSKVVSQFDVERFDCSCGLEQTQAAIRPTMQWTWAYLWMKYQHTHPSLRSHQSSSPMVLQYSNCNWQCPVDYSVACFDCIAAFEAPYRWTSIKGGAYTCFIEAWIPNKFMKCLTSVMQHFEHSNGIEICGRISFNFYTGLPAMHINLLFIGKNSTWCLLHYQNLRKREW